MRGNKPPPSPRKLPGKKPLYTSFAPLFFLLPYGSDRTRVVYCIQVGCSVRRFYPRQKRQLIRTEQRRRVRSSDAHCGERHEKGAVFVRISLQSPAFRLPFRPPAVLSCRYLRLSGQSSSNVPHPGSPRCWMALSVTTRPFGVRLRNPFLIR